MVCFVPSSGLARPKPRFFGEMVCRSQSISSAGSVVGSRIFMSASGARDQEHQGRDGDTSSWRDDLRLLLDPSLSLSAKSVLLQDMSKRAPEIGKEAFEDVCSSAGLEGVPAVVQQMSEDVVPDLLSNGPQYATEVGKRVPDAISSAVGTIQSGGSLSGGVAAAPGEFISAVGQELRNVFNKTPEGLETPDFESLGQYQGYELRRYPDIVVAETPMVAEGGSKTSEVAAASSMGTSFSTLAKYLFGSNTSGKPMAMTTPVVMDYHEGQDGRMSFVLPSKYSDDVVAAPQPVSPVSDTVSVTVRPGAVYAVAEFPGFATAGEIRRQLTKLNDFLEKDGVAACADEYTVLVYNGPGTVAFMRRNELCMRVNIGSNADEIDFSDVAPRSGEGVATRTGKGSNENGSFIDVGTTTD